ncbi:MAG: hypothetical protein IJ638_00405, partial [Alphaproteobacteria bacterium]|nr:hypothetical protein [Alphaproteobacteria bacterium]
DSGSGCGWHCAEGYYADGSSCTICPKGSYCTGGVKRDCSGKNEFQDKEGQTSCDKVSNHRGSCDSVFCSACNNATITNCGSCWKKSNSEIRCSSGRATCPNCSM